MVSFTKIKNTKTTSNYANTMQQRKENISSTFKLKSSSFHFSCQLISRKIIYYIE